MVQLNEIKTRLSKGELIEDIIRDINWHEFENFAATIFKEHDYDVFQNFRFKTKNRYEIDLLVVKSNLVIAVDCKQWGRGRYKKSAIKDSVTKQIKRTKELEKILVGENLKIKPLIITLFEEDIVKHENVWIVPVWKLNEFLLE